MLLCILENQRGLTPKKLVAAANALELDTQLPLEAHEVDSEAVGARTGAGLRIDWWEVTPNLEH
jgi:hypothetical protein